jgi:hypothetical protein
VGIFNPKEEEAVCPPPADEEEERHIQRRAHWLPQGPAGDPQSVWLWSDDRQRQS